MKIALDAGHGFNTAGKRTPDGTVREWTLNNRVLVAMQNQLYKYEGVSTLRLDDPTGKNNVDRVTRVNKATDWGADILISIHHNAFENKMSSFHGGTETFYQHENSKVLAQVMLNAIVGSYGLKNRGVKQKAFDIINYFKNPSTLVECGFMDSNNDVVIHDDARAKKLGVDMAKALATHYGLKLKTNNEETPEKPVDKPTVPSAGKAMINKGAIYKSKSEKYNNTKVPDRYIGVPMDYKMHQSTEASWVYFPAVESYVDMSQVTFGGEKPVEKPITPKPNPTPSGKATINKGAVYKSKSSQYNNVKVPEIHTGVPLDYKLNQTSNKDWVYFPTLQSYVDKSQVTFGDKNNYKDLTGTTIKMGNGTVLRDSKGNGYSLVLKFNTSVKVLSQIGDGINGNTLLRFKAPWLIGVTEAYVYLKDVKF